MSEIYNRVCGRMSTYSSGRSDYFSEVFWFSRAAIEHEAMESHLVYEDILEELSSLAGMTTKGDKYYSFHALQHIIDRVGNGLLQITFDDGVADAARNLIAGNVFERFEEEVKPILLWLGDSTLAGSIEEKMSRSPTAKMRAGHYMKWFTCVEVVNEMLKDHEKGKYAMVGAVTGFLMVGKNSPLSYASSGILPFFQRMREKGVKYEL